MIQFDEWNFQMGWNTTYNCFIAISFLCFLVAFRSFAVSLHCTTSWKLTSTEACRDSHNWQLALWYSAARNEAFKPGRNAHLISGRKTFSQGMNMSCDFSWQLQWHHQTSILKSLLLNQCGPVDCLLFWFTEKQRFSKSGLLFDALDTPSTFDKGGGGWPSQMDVSKNNGTPKSSILIGFSTINHPFWVPLFLETPRFWSDQVQRFFPNSKAQKRRELDTSPPQSPWRNICIQDHIYIHTMQYIYNIFIYIYIFIFIYIYTVCTWLYILILNIFYYNFIFCVPFIL